MHPYTEKKLELKEIAKKIVVLKFQRKPNNNTSGKTQSEIIDTLFDSKLEYRMKHIIYCLARGRTMEQIENKVSKSNKLDKYKLSHIDGAFKVLKKEAAEYETKLLAERKDKKEKRNETVRSNEARLTA